MLVINPLPGKMRLFSFCLSLNFGTYVAIVHADVGDVPFTAKGRQFGNIFGGFGDFFGNFFGNSGNGQRNDRYGVQNEEYGMQNHAYGMQNDGYGVQNDEYGMQTNEYGTQNNEYGIQNDGYGMQNQGNGNGMRNNEYGGPMQYPQTNNYKSHHNDAYDNNNYYNNQPSQSVGGGSYGNRRNTNGNNNYQLPSDNNQGYQGYDSNTYWPVMTSTHQPAMYPYEPTNTDSTNTVNPADITTFTTSTTSRSTTTTSPTTTPALERCGIPSSNSEFFTKLQGVSQASRFPSLSFARDDNVTELDGSGERANGDRIVGGFDVPLGAGSECWQVQILITFENGARSYCGASIVGSRTVISAAHCLKPELGPTDNFDLRRTPVSVQTGPTVKARTVSGFFQSVPDCGEIIPVVRAIPVPGYDNLFSVNNDLVIFVLERDIDFVTRSACACKLCMRRQGPQVGDMCLVSGFGGESRREFGAPPTPPLREQVPLKITTQLVRPNDASNCFLTFDVNIRLFICAGGNEPTDSCQGDSGGPLFCFDRSSRRQYLAGVVSHGRGCGLVGVSAMYTDLSKYFDNFLLPNIPAGQITIIPSP